MACSLTRPEQTLHLEWYDCVALHCGEVVMSLWREQKTLLLKVALGNANIIAG